MSLLFKSILPPIKKLLIITLVGFSPLIQADNKVPEPFKGSKPDSTLTIDYTDISNILDVSVFDVGRSFREKAKKTKASIGTRLKSSRNVHTSLEANRFYFKAFKEKENMEQLLKIRSSLEALPDEVPLKIFNEKEQLAYWLNLYNITLLSEIIEVSGKSVLKKFLYGKDSILDKKLLNVSGIALSLNDIQTNIVYPKYSHRPVVMYGFYQGIIGGPNIRTEAYDGARVYKQLDDNAEEFVNSNRGTYYEKRGRLRVSSLYKRNEVLFPNFNADLKSHLLKYAVGKYEDLISDANYYKPDIKDMHIANLRAGVRKFGGSVAKNTAAMIDSVALNTVDPAIGGLDGVSGINSVNQSFIGEVYSDGTISLGNYSVDEITILSKLRLNSRIRAGNVTITEENESEDKKE